ncbi:MAG: RnfABCDGE type electron transport complex subunit D [Spirochaetaceae bacterium]|jgi:electron transport complex protein RnfD|nr:RnfABCDGE type electron transport complex subunit D [Spirochaetaceae bacterium]
MIERDIALFERPLLSFARSTRARMGIISGCAAAVILQSALSDSFFSLLIALAAVAGAFSAELLVSFLRKQRLVSDLSALASALIFTLMLPNTINPAFAFLGTFFALAVVKGSFGGLGSNWLNPALAGWLFVRFSWPELFSATLSSSSMVPIGAIGTSTADFYGTNAGFLYANIWRSVYGTVEFLNRTVFQVFSTEIPSGLASFLVNTEPVIIADRGVLALIAASILICASMHKFRLSALYLIIYLVLVRFCGGWTPFIEEGDMFYCLFSGGTLLAAFILCADPATSPKSMSGKVLTTVCAALLSFIFRYLRLELYGAFFAVAAINLICPVIRVEESKRIYNREDSQ